MTNTEFAKHIYSHCLSVFESKKFVSDWDEKDDRQVINYIANLMELHFEPDTHLGSKGFLSISKMQLNNDPNFGC